MRRFSSPFNGKKYVLNTNSCEIHDLDAETNQCKISEIKPEHIFNCDSYEEAEIHSSLFLRHTANGCFYCLPSKNNG